MEDVKLLNGGLVATFLIWCTMSLNQHFFNFFSFPCCYQIRNYSLTSQLHVYNNNSNSNNSNNNNNNNDNDNNKVRLQIYQPFSVALLTINATASFGNESCTFVLIGIHSMQG